MSSWQRAPWTAATPTSTELGGPLLSDKWLLAWQHQELGALRCQLSAKQARIRALEAEVERLRVLADRPILEGEEGHHHGDPE